MTSRPNFRRLPPDLQTAVKQAAHELAKRVYSRERDALANTVLHARAQGADPAQALAQAIRAKISVP